MKKKTLLALLLVIASLATACSSTAQTTTQTAAQTTVADTTEKPEVSTIHWARANSGNIFVSLAQKKGYFKEYGLNVIEDPVKSTNDALTALGVGKVDVTSNNGTDNPLRFIAQGQDFTIVGGYMLKGMYIVAKNETPWDGPLSLIGKKIACPASATAITGALLDLGHDPINEVEWLTYSTNNDRLSAVIAGEADYALLSGDLLQKVGEMSNQIRIVAWSDDLTKNYGCCRMNMRTKFTKDNPITTKLLLKAVLRAECDYNKNIDEAVSILCEEIDKDKDYVEAYLKNPNYRASVDPVKKSVEKTWDVMCKTGFIEKDAQERVVVDDHINTSFYKQALDELLEEYKGTEDEAFYQGRLTFFNENN